MIEKAAKVSLTNSWASQSWRCPSSRSEPILHPMNSMMTAKIGTPRMNAAKFRWTCAMTQTMSREPR